MRLVDLLDDLLPRLEADPAYAHFMLDGQMAVVDDHLEIRPEAEGALRRLAAAGRLSMGPWYVAHGRVPGVGRDHRPRPPDGPAPGGRLRRCDGGRVPARHVRPRRPDAPDPAPGGPRPRRGLAGRALGDRPVRVLVGGARRLDRAGRVPPGGLRQRGRAPRHGPRAGRDGPPVRGHPRRDARRADPLDERHRPPDAAAAAHPPRGRGQRRPGRLPAGDQRAGRPRGGGTRRRPPALEGRAALGGPGQPADGRGLQPGRREAGRGPRRALRSSAWPSPSPPSSSQPAGGPRRSSTGRGARSCSTPPTTRAAPAPSTRSSTPCWPATPTPPTSPTGWSSGPSTPWPARSPSPGPPS